MTDIYEPRENERMLKLSVNQIGAAAEDKLPDLALYSLSEDGKALEVLAVSKAGTMDVETAVLAKQERIGIGPHVDDIAALDPQQLVGLRTEDVLPGWQRDAVLDLPAHWWGRWLWKRICVSGHVRKCRPWWFGDIVSNVSVASALNSHAITSIASKLDNQLHINPGILDRILPFPRCRPICDGRVEVFERVCCCRYFVLFDPRIDQLIERLREIVVVRPPIPEPEPGPDPAPFEGLRLRSQQLSSRIALRAMKQSLQQPIATTEIASERLSDDLKALESMPRAEAHSYINANLHLWPLFCHCSMRKVGEAAIHTDGSFTFCYRRFLTLNPIGQHCTTTYAYHVHQVINGSDHLIYDGIARHEYFAANEDAILKSYSLFARDCADAPQPPVDHERPFVMLQDVGGARTHRLLSPAQNAVMGLNNASLPANAGLLDPPPPFRTAVWQPGDTQPFDRPWARGLALRLYFHPGMQALGAVYYRISIASANAQGNPTGTPEPLTAPLSWDRWEYVAGMPHKVGESLGPTPLVDSNGDTQAGLYRIPYWSSTKLWLTDQFHAVWDTTPIVDGKRLVIVEVFDASGNRLRPTGATGTGIDQNFSMLRWVDETVPTAIPFATLAHLFWVNNQLCYGDIEDLRMNGIASSQECQFMSGNANSQFSAGFRAYHQHGTNVAVGQSFMWYYTLWYHRGLNGPDVTIETQGLNAPTSLGSGSAAVSAAQSFGSMLDGHQKCTFALNLRVYGKHTNGSGIDLGDTDQAAFALEQ